ncbi:hypothetical protein BGZ96_012437 [Linnemannia gamsii]|uniref:Uncharacterized protein n=1 Tax=Linnemannia gamsii TaxID=64522 RepID=A0ABQ7KC76_9FUNG|nr:hypothetical protein BGZ96_012437 [Linnemannia gamsii]
MSYIGLKTLIYMQFRTLKMRFSVIFVAVAALVAVVQASPAPAVPVSHEDV